MTTDTTTPTRPEEYVTLGTYITGNPAETLREYADQIRARLFGALLQRVTGLNSMSYASDLFHDATWLMQHIRPKDLVHDSYTFYWGTNGEFGTHIGEDREAILEHTQTTYGIHLELRSPTTYTHDVVAQILELPR